MYVQQRLTSYQQQLAQAKVSFEQRMEEGVSVDASEPEPEPDAESSANDVGLGLSDIVRLGR